MPDRRSRRLADPVTGRPLQALLVVDVDLDSGAVSEQLPLTPFRVAPEGVHAIVWLHGEPIGELTAHGPPTSVLPDLVRHARHQLAFPVFQHLLHDALSTRSGIGQAVRSGLASVPHPPPEPDLDACTVSVAVCTRDRPEALRRCLTSLAALHDPVLEVLVIDNASRDGATRDVAASFPFVRRVSEPRQGLDWARNRALLEARADVVAFTDDDVVVHPGWIGGLLRALREEPTAVGVTGLVVPRELSTPSQVLFEAVGGFGRGYRRRWFSAAIDRGEVSAAVFGSSGVAGTGANMAFRRQRLIDLGGFDTALDVGTPSGGGGDLEAFFRVVAAGHLLVYEPSAVVRHVHRSSFDELVRQMRGNGTGSYSYVLGAGRRYGRAQSLVFARTAVEWAVHGHARNLLRTALAPDLFPIALRWAETRGAVDAVLGRYYRRARTQAVAQHAVHGGPQVPEPVRRPAVDAGCLPPGPVLSVDLTGEQPVQAPAAPAAPAGPVHVRVHRGCEVQDVCAVDTRGSALTTSRLRWALVDALGPAALIPGSAYDGLGGTPVGTAEPAPEIIAGGRPLIAESQRAFLARLVAGPADVEARGATSAAATVVITSVGSAAARDRTLAAVARDVCTTRTEVSPDAQRTIRDAGSPPVGSAIPAPVACSMSEALATASTEQDALVPVLFVQAGSVPTVGWLDRMTSGFDDPDVAVVLGNVLPQDLDTADSQALLARLRLHRGPRRRTWSATSGPQRRAGGAWPASALLNVAVRRSWLEGMAPALTDPSGDDATVDECLDRVLTCGGKVSYEPCGVVLLAP